MLLIVYLVLLILNEYMGKQYKVILADDDLDDRELFIELLSDLNVDITTLGNGFELLNYLETQTAEMLPDCLFLDLNMPVLGGKESLQRIRSNQKYKQMPIVIYSTSANRNDIEETFKMGANLYLVKASSYITLKNILQNVVKLDWQQQKQQPSLANFVFKS